MKERTLRILEFNKIKDKVELLSDKNIEKINKSYTLEKVESMMELPKCSPMIVIG